MKTQRFTVHTGVFTFQQLADQLNEIGKRSGAEVSQVIYADGQFVVIEKRSYA